jgi:prepilin-type N-terminal cleavage/methylation domain-containing protein
MKNFKSQQGFTLIEILVVIGMIALLAAIVLIAINPARQFAQGRQTQRTNDVTTILNSIGQYTADNKGVLPAAIPLTTAQDISKAGADLCATLSPTYVSSFPVDPSVAGGSITDCVAAAAANYNTKYTVVKDANGRVTVCAPQAATESAIAGATSICITR